MIQDKGTLYLLPNLLSDDAEIGDSLPQTVASIIEKLDLVICETEKPARRFLGRFKRASLPLMVLNEHTKENELAELIKPLEEGKQVGLLSDAGIACIADPGAELVRLANARGIPVEALVGPCSIILALQLSGFCGQRFSLHGYLPRESEARKASISRLEAKARREASTEIFIEAPYRNNELLKDLCATLSPEMQLAVAVDLTGKNQQFFCMSVKNWRLNSIPDINKRPAIFLICAS